MTPTGCPSGLPQRQALEERRDGARWTTAGMIEAQKTFRRLKAYRQLPILRKALEDHMRKAQANSAIETIVKAAWPVQPAMPASPFSTEMGTSPLMSP